MNLANEKSKRTKGLMLMVEDDPEMKETVPKRHITSR
jgi:hypothetical protein